MRFHIAPVVGTATILRSLSSGCAGTPATNAFKTGVSSGKPTFLNYFGRHLSSQWKVHDTFPTHHATQTLALALHVFGRSERDNSQWEKFKNVRLPELTPVWLEQVDGNETSRSDGGRVWHEPMFWSSFRRAPLTIAQPAEQTPSAPRRPN